jgi:hypothetical protein
MIVIVPAHYSAYQAFVAYSAMVALELDAVLIPTLQQMNTCVT